jgi:hypothetical protein
LAHIPERRPSGHEQAGRWAMDLNFNFTSFMLRFKRIFQDDWHMASSQVTTTD